MKKTLLSLGLLFTVGATYAQQIDRCMSPHAITYQESLTPGFAAHVDEIFNQAKAMVINHEQKSGTVYTIPVVVHIVHNIAAQNLPDSVIYNQIAVLNEDYQRMNADTVNMRPAFDPVKGNPKIKFVLAQIDPNGMPTNGITRTNTATASFGSLALIGGDFSDLEKIKSTADGGIDPWDQTHYLNIWVGNMSVTFLGQEITALLGYATPPAGLPNWPPGSTNGLSDGVVIQYQAFGANNPNVLDAGGGPIEVLGRTTVHEVGHYLGLRHIWGDGDCTAEDGIDDTPNADAQSNQDCDITKNTCVDNIVGVDLPDMVENYMDYSAETCQNSFTQGQVDLIYGVLESERYDLVHGNPAGLSEIEHAVTNVYPNPSSGLYTIEFNQAVTEVVVTDIYGQEIIAVPHPLLKLPLNIQSQPNGMYFISFTTETGMKSSQRIIKF